ncbi:GNAT family N-acetyltransferase [Cyclobacterium amurskyense]|uniref:Transcriptional regulator, MarR family n=1 Tax=Cyclobacterium amurskyense TaxID=320787 RepID=A0A0H4P5A2_9BACT|nr:GNAT family N-acetyltransferase [Cyclobacterium amurskyense]AKP49571.1 Transcriptional regulator, MarR family [Cyclobacterium amurskyense]|tara:strand:- start:236 stop:697 length:462 start_codon:yes stop_codon:yes gene_type:complete
MEKINIHLYTAALAPYFLSINQEWIEKYFVMEAFDIAQLQKPQETIRDHGGEVLFAEWEKEIVGTVALKKINESQYELIKMGVSPKAQGKNIGHILGNAALDWAKAQGATKVILYSNSLLAPAIALYRKMGFKEIPMECGTYERCDIKMEYIF